jgi:hypothetical protein
MTAWRSFVRLIWCSARTPCTASRCNRRRLLDRRSGGARRVERGAHGRRRSRCDWREGVHGVHLHVLRRSLARSGQHRRHDARRAADRARAARSPQSRTRRAANAPLVGAEKLVDKLGLKMDTHARGARCHDRDGGQSDVRCSTVSRASCRAGEEARSQVRRHATLVVDENMTSQVSFRFCLFFFVILTAKTRILS